MKLKYLKNLHTGSEKTQTKIHPKLGNSSPSCVLDILTSVGAPGLWQLLTSPFLSSFSPRRNSLLRSVPRRISFSRGGVMSIGGVVLDGGCERQNKQRHEKKYL